MMFRRVFCGITSYATGIFLTLMYAPADATSLSATRLVANQEGLNRFCPTAFPDLRAEYASAYSRWIQKNRDRIDRVRALPDYDQTLEQVEQNLSQETDSATQRAKCDSGMRALNNSNWQALLELSLGNQPSAGGAPAPVSRATASDSCGMKFGSLQSAGSHSRGRVEGFVTRQEAMALINSAQHQLNGTLSPAYIENQRLKVGPVTSDPGRQHHAVTVVVPVGMEVNIGDVVDFVTARPDPALSCHYIPNMIDHVVVLSR